ncbi:MAG: hypothetical protein ACRC28_18060 [Clostridium sp.]|uniref:hypothetical protein n=1 Tax=Clostridium sp. TaxID=1506 RepID=UPI003F32C5D4
MKKSILPKIIIAIIAIIVVIGIIFAGHNLIKGEKGEKTIHITVEDSLNHHYLVKDKEFHTDAKTLADFLKENQKELKVNFEQTKWGPFITGMMGLNSPSMDKGPWWMYGYDSPSQKLNFKVGAAPASDKINLANGDSVDFVYTANMGS